MAKFSIVNIVQTFKVVQKNVIFHDKFKLHEYGLNTPSYDINKILKDNMMHGDIEINLKTI